VGRFLTLDPFHVCVDMFGSWLREKTGESVNAKRRNFLSDCRILDAGQEGALLLWRALDNRMSRYSDT
jgi:hypothetical protein